MLLGKPDIEMLNMPTINVKTIGTKKMDIAFKMQYKHSQKPGCKMGTTLYEHKAGIWQARKVL